MVAFSHWSKPAPFLSLISIYGRDAFSLAAGLRPQWTTNTGGRQCAFARLPQNISAQCLTVRPRRRNCELPFAKGGKGRRIRIAARGEGFAEQSFGRKFDWFVLALTKLQKESQGLQVRRKCLDFQYLWYWFLLELDSIWIWYQNLSESLFDWLSSLERNGPRS